RKRASATKLAPSFFPAVTSCAVASRVPGNAPPYAALVLTLHHALGDRTSRHNGACTLNLVDQRQLLDGDTGRIALVELRERHGRRQLDSADPAGLRGKHGLVRLALEGT